MTVKDLIKQLKKFDAALPVHVQGYEYGFGEMVPKALKVRDLEMDDYFNSGKRGPKNVKALCLSGDMLKAHQGGYGGVYDDPKDKS